MTTPLDDGASRLEGTYEHLDTRAYMAEMKAELKSDFADLKADLAELKSDLIKWMIGLMLGSAVVSILISLLFVKFIC